VLLLLLLLRLTSRLRLLLLLLLLVLLMNWCAIRRCAIDRGRRRARESTHRSSAMHRSSDGCIGSRHGCAVGASMLSVLLNANARRRWYALLLLLLLLRLLFERR
jgi:hypothetical protein